MVDANKWMSARTRLGLGGAALLVLGAAGGAAAVATTRPGVEMAPANAVAIASLAQRDGIVTIKGRVAEIYGDRFVVADASGRTMVNAGPVATNVQAGAPVTVQGRYDNGQLRASFLVDQNGTVEPVGPPPGRRHDRHGPEGRDGPPPPPPGCGPASPDLAPPPAAGAAPAVPPAPAAR